MVILAPLAATPPEQEVATLCVHVTTAAATPQEAPDVRDLVTAIRARVGRRLLRVRTCDEPEMAPANWRATIASTEGAIELSLEGGELAAQHKLDVQAQGEQVLIQRIALLVAETVRPAVDALLIQLGYTPESSEIPPEAVTQLETRTSDLPNEAAASTPPREHSLAVALGAYGPGLGISAGGTVQLAATLLTGPVHVRLHLAGDMSLPRRFDGIRVQSEQLQMGTALGGTWGPLTTGLGPVARMTLVQTRSGRVEVRRGTQIYWSPGLFWHVSAWPIRGEHWQLGMTARVGLWWRPRKLVFEGRELARQSHVDGALLLTAAYPW